MSDTVVSLLTPVGVGAITTVEVRGPRAWELARQLFRPAGKPLPERPELHRFWFGTLGEGAGDEVILAVTEVLASGGCEPPGESRSNTTGGLTPPARQSITIEIHCHGGRRVVRWVINQFLASGGCEPPGESRSNTTGRLTSPARLLQNAPTLRTAAILLDQMHGAFDNAVRRVLELLEANDASNYPMLLTEFSDLVRFAPIGRHLVEPWRVVVAGPPNVGKSSLVNALAGYQRAVVSEIAGTTRDVVSVQLAFDGWPVVLIDTAGLRDAEGLEAEGIDRARRMLAEADLVVWVMDGTMSPVQRAGDDIPPTKLLAVFNKADVMVERQPNPAAEPWTLLVSATTGAGLPKLVKWITTIFVPEQPPPGAAVPYTPELASMVTDAYLGLVYGNGNAKVRAEAIRLLCDCLRHD